MLGISLLGGLAGIDSFSGLADYAEMHFEALSKHLINAWCEANELVLAQQKVTKKSNEITAIPHLIRLLDLHNRVITIDAMVCQRDICEQIIEQGGNYVISLKGNQGTLLEDTQGYFEHVTHEHIASWEEHDKGHGRRC